VTAMRRLGKRRKEARTLQDAPAETQI